MTDLWVYPLGVSLGSERVPVKNLIDEFGPVRDGFLDRTGFTDVYRADESETSLSLARAAIGSSYSSWLATTVDAVISVGSTPDRVAPGNAHLLQTELGLRHNILLLDLNDACTGFVRAMHLANALLASESASTVLVVVADTYSKLYSPSNLKISPLFSDGASALVVSKAALLDAPTERKPRHWRILSSSFVSEGGGANELSITRSQSASAGLGELDMNGAGVFNFVLSHLASTVARLTSTVPLESSPIDKWFVHQGSRAVVTAVERSLKVPSGSLFRAGDYGNTVGSSIPFQLWDDLDHEADKTIGMLAFGVGLTMAGLIIQQLPFGTMEGSRGA